MPVHDWHPEANLRHEIWAELEGIPSHTSSSSLLPKALRMGGGGGGGNGRSPSASRGHSPLPSRHHSPVGSPARSPASSRPSSPGPGHGQGSRRHMPLPDLSTLSIDTSIPRIPSYEQSEAEASGVNTPVEEVPMLEGTYRVTRNIRAVYNPNANGGTTALDDRLEGMAPGLGVYRMHLRSPLVCHFPLHSFPLSPRQSEISSISLTLPTVGSKRLSVLAPPLP